MTAILHHVVRPVAQAGPALLLIHPLGADLQFWTPLLDQIGHRVASVACDLRGAGSSPHSEGPVTIEDHVADLERLRLSLGLAQVIPVGCAIGAMTAAAYAATFAHRCPAVVLSNPTAKTLEPARAMLSARAAQVLERGIDSILPGAVDKAFCGQPLDRQYDRYYERFARQDPKGYANSILGILHADVSDHLRRLRCPTLVLGAGLDLLLPIEHALAVHGLVAASQYAQIDEAAHFAPLQRPEAFSVLLFDFLRRHQVLTAC